MNDEEKAAFIEGVEKSLLNSVSYDVEGGHEGGYDDAPLNATLAVIQFLDVMGYTKIAMRYAYQMTFFEYNWENEPEWEVYRELNGRDTMSDDEFFEEFGRTKVDSQLTDVYVAGQMRAESA